MFENCADCILLRRLWYSGTLAK